MELPRQVQVVPIGGRWDLGLLILFHSLREQTRVPVFSTPKKSFYQARGHPVCSRPPNLQSPIREAKKRGRKTLASF